MTLLHELQARRAHECRLTPDRGLESLDEAEAFLRDRGLLTLTPSCSLPSLFEACRDDPYDASKQGFAQWPKTKWSWGAALEERPGVYTPRIHRGRLLYLTAETASFADPVCRAEIERMQASDPERSLLLRHLADAGPSLLEDLQIELGLKPRELKKIRAPLERCGAIVSRGVKLKTDGGHVHTSELARWDHVFLAPAGGEPDLGPLVVAAVRASVVVPDREPRRWFSWAWEDGLLDRLVAEGRLIRPEPGWLSAP
jgi:hypothetical protein